MGLNWTIQDHTGSYGTIWDYMGPYGTIRDNTGTYGTIQDHMGPYRTIWDLKGPYGTIQDRMGPYRTIGDDTGPYGSSGPGRGKIRISILSKTPKTVLIITQQPNIAQMPFCIQNERQISFITSFKDHCCSFFTS